MTSVTSMPSPDRRPCRRILTLVVAVAAALLGGCAGLGGAGPIVIAVPAADVVPSVAVGSVPTLACDWDADGVDTLATVTAGRWMVRDTDGRALYAESVVFGRAPGDVPLCGDWDGDGDDEPGVFRAGSFHLRSDLGAAATTTVAPIGAAGDTPVVGDWDGDGVDTPGVLHDGRWLLAGEPDGSDVDRPHGGLEPGDRAVVGDWDGDGVDTIGVVGSDGWYTTGGRPGIDDPDHLDGAGQGGVAVAMAVSGGHDRPTVVRPSTPTDGPVAIHVFGDSLASESQAAFRQAISTGRRRRVEVHHASHGGTAMCDYHDEIAASVVQRPDLVVLSFSGNNITDCTLREPGEGTCPSRVVETVRRQLESCRRRGVELYRQYRDDLRWAVASVAPIPVVLVAPPTMSNVVTGENPRPGTGRTGWIWKAYREVAAEQPNVTLVDGGALLTPDDEWVEELPCLPGEDCPTTAGPGDAGPALAVVRSPDGIHLCSGAFAGVRTEGGCPPGMPGPYRFAAVAADAAAALLGL